MAELLLAMAIGILGLNVPIRAMVVRSKEPGYVFNQSALLISTLKFKVAIHNNAVMAQVG